MSHPNGMNVKWIRHREHDAKQRHPSKPLYRPRSSSVVTNCFVGTNCSVGFEFSDSAASSESELVAEEEKPKHKGQAIFALYVGGSASQPVSHA